MTLVHQNLNDTMDLKMKMDVQTFLLITLIEIQTEMEF
jgi:hypothetical protein